MAKKVQHISLKKSTIKGKAPLATDLVDGELAVNIAKDGEKIFLKNTANNIVGFSSDGLLDKKYLSTTSGGTVSGDTEFKGDVKIVYPDSSSQTVSLREVMVKNEKVIAAALNDLNERNDELSAKVTEQKTDIDNLSQKYLPLSGGTMSGDIRYNKQEITSHLNSGATYGISGVTISRLGIDGANSVNTIRTDEIKIALKNERQRLETATTISAYSVTSSKFVKTGATADDILLGNGTIKSVNDFLQTSGGTVSGDTTFSGGLKFRYPDVSSTPVSLRDVIADNEEVTATALNDLNDKINKIGDISIANGVLIINDGNRKYKLNLEQLVTGKFATKE